MNSSFEKPTHTRTALWALLVGLAGASSPAWPLTREELQLVALQVSDDVAADPAVVARIEHHIESIARREPALEQIQLTPRFRGTELMLQVEPSTEQAIAAGKYDAWSSLHSRVRVRNVRIGFQAISIQYAGIYNTPRLAEEYRRLPGVLDASPNWVVGDGSYIYIHRQGAEWRYIFDIGSGDCISGCSEHELLYFVVDDSDAVLSEQRWSTHSTDPSPAWVEQWKKLRRGE